MQDGFQSQNVTDSVILRLDDFKHGMEWYMFSCLENHLTFFKKKIAAIVLDLISHFDANSSCLVQRTLLKTLKCVSCSDFLSQKWH